MPSLRTILATAGAGALAVTFALGPSVLEIAVAADRVDKLTLKAARLARADLAGAPAPASRPESTEPTPSAASTRRSRPAPGTTAPPARRATTGAPPKTEGGRPVVYLTIDDGPDPSWTPRVLSLLSTHRAEATFFLVGQKVAQGPAAVQQIRKDGHAIGNHTYTHPWLTKLPTADVVNEMAGTDALLGKTTCMRPPGGFVDARVAKLAAASGKSVELWGLDTHDWRRPGTESIVTTVLKGVHPGAVILMHDGGGDRSQTITALERILPALTARGYLMRSLPTCR